MKIFGKRTKKATTPNACATAEDAAVANKVFESDKVVEELLQLDPQQWNAKQRRMIKRYQERQIIEHQSGTDDHEKPNTVTSDDKTMGVPNDLVLKSAIHNTSDATEKRDQNDGDSEIAITQPNVPEQNEREMSSSGLDQGSSHSIETEVTSILQKLNSKHRRLLSRRLEREGTGILEEVRQQALALLEAATCTNVAENESKIVEKSENVEETKHSPNNTTSSDAHKEKGEHNPNNTTSADAPVKRKSKKRKQQVDWSSLSAEERLRREEQRRLQQEAEERQKEAQHDSSKLHRHPLNSERRRANRRKPKWGQKSKTMNEQVTANSSHNSSGFHIRKRQKTRELSVKTDHSL